MNTLSSILVFILANPLAQSKEIQLAVEQPVRRVYEECCMMKFAGEGGIPNRETLMTMHNIVDGWPDKFDELPLFETLEDGLYTRELHMPKATIIVGKIHKYPYYASVLKGKCLILSEFYNKTIEAPHSFTLPAGVKHIVFNLEDTVWSDVHTGTWGSIEEASEEIFASSYEELDEHLNIIKEVV